MNKHKRDDSISHNVTRITNDFSDIFVEHKFNLVLFGSVSMIMASTFIEGLSSFATVLLSF